MTRPAGIEARFPGHCVRCGRDIVPGERITPRPGRDPLHVACAPGGDDE